MLASIGRPQASVEAAFRRRGFKWEEQHDNRYVIYGASKGKLSYSFQFARRKDTSSWVCEEVSRSTAAQTFRSLAPSDWRNYEIYISNEVYLNHEKRYSHDTNIVLIKRKPRGEYARWSFRVDDGSSMIRCVATGNRWKLSMSPSWFNAKVAYYEVALGGVAFGRAFSGEEEDVEVDNPKYSRKEGSDRGAVRWRPSKKATVFYFPRRV
jgi:hypothetical protein